MKFEEVCREIVVTGGDASPLHELGEAPDVPAFLVGDTVVAMSVLAVAMERDDRLVSLFDDKVVQTVGIIGFVCDD